MKPAVFQVNAPDGTARLLCVYVSTMKKALELETLLQERAGRHHVELLGRFDTIDTVMSAQDAVALAFEPDSRRAAGELSGTGPQ